MAAELEKSPPRGVFEAGEASGLGAGRRVGEEVLGAESAGKERGGAVTCGARAEREVFFLWSSVVKKSGPSLEQKSFHHHPLFLSLSRR